MNLTAIRALKSALKDVDSLCSEVIKENSREVLFPSHNALEHIYNDVAPTSPQDYFYFRIMEKYIELCFSMRHKRYYLHFEHYFPSFQNDYEKVKAESDFYMPKNTDFHYAIKEFQKCCIDLLHRSENSSPELFYMF